MPAQWATFDAETGIVTGVKGDGTPFTFNLSELPGQGFNAQRLARIEERVQAEFDTRQVQADLPADDSDRTASAADLLAKYGNRVFLDGADIVSRSTLISLSWDGTQLIPRLTRVV